MKLRKGLLLVMALWGCSGRTDHQENRTQKDSLLSDQKNAVERSVSDDRFLSLNNYLVKGGVDTSKQKIVDVDCAMLIYPTQDQIDEMKKREGEENFLVEADDNQWYQGMAIETIDSVGIKIQTTTRQFLKCTGDLGTWTLDIRRKNMPAWNLIFFRRNKMPKIVSSMDLTSNQVRDYFEITR